MNRLSDATLNGMTKKQLIEYVSMRAKTTQHFNKEVQNGNHKAREEA